MWAWLCVGCWPVELVSQYNIACVCVESCLAHPNPSLVNLRSGLWQAQAGTSIFS
ncbi:hypothetical protein FKM82_006243 [Ascaphus truei]